MGLDIGVQSLWTFFVHTLYSFSPICSWKLTSVEVAFYLGSLLTSQQSWCPIYIIHSEMAPSLSGTCCNCPKNWHVTHCLGLVNICWIKKGILETHLFCVSFLLSFFVFTDSVFLHLLASLLFHIQSSHSRSSWSVPIQSGVTRKQGSQTSYQWDAYFIFCSTFNGLPFTRVWHPILWPVALVNGLPDPELEESVIRG